MNPRTVAASLAAALVTALAAPPLLAQDGALARCRAIAEPAQRLACYDALPLPSAAATAAASVASPAATPATAAPPPPPPADRFGLPTRIASEVEPPSLRSSVAADFDGWGPTTRIRLANGQVWQVSDGSSGVVTPAQRQVTVRRGALGTYFLEFDGLNRSPRVRRVE